MKQGPRQDAVKALAVLFMREPVAGRAKTRMAGFLGADRAVAWYRDQLVSLSLGLQHADGIELVASITPESSVIRMSRLLKGMRFWVQKGKDLGERIREALSRGLASGYEKVMVVATDVPDLSPQDLEAASSALDRSPVVLGPCPDGGYYLIGIRSEVPDLWSGVRWSTDTVLDTTLSLADALGIAPILLRSLRDIDSAKDWLEFYSC